MKTSATAVILALAGLLVAPSLASARTLSVELWTDRGNDAVYQPGDPILIKARTNDDAYMLVYEIDALGGVNLLFPAPGHGAGIEGRRTYRLPGGDRDEFVVDQTTGEGFIVAIASRTPFEALPWYLRPVDLQASEIGYVGEPDEEEGVTREGRIVGDPFVAMERIRRRVLKNASDDDGFATAYVNYYVHERVRYPRYLCNDCHRPGRYAWWDGWDPYYTRCSVFDFRINWSWGWGPRYWYGTVPYFVYVYRDDCPPHYRRYAHSGVWYSGWDGWNRWCDLWGTGGLRRYKSPPPPGYTPPAVYERDYRVRRGPPPGFIASTVEKRGGLRQGVGIGASNPFVGDERLPQTRDRRDVTSERRRVPRPDEGGGLRIGDQQPSRDGRGDAPRGERTRGSDSPGYRSPREARAPERPRPEYAPPRDEGRGSDRPREVQRAPEPQRRDERAPERPRQEYRAPDPQRRDPPRAENPRSRGGGESRPARDSGKSKKDR